jgi:preprotein translocase subunit SecB
MEKKIENNPKYEIIANYIKDLSFEIPCAESFLDAAQNLGKYETKIDISNKPLKNGILELNFKIFFEAPKDIKNKIHAEGCLAIIFKITDTKLKEEEIKRIILAEIPGLYGNKLSNLMADLFQKSGFKEFRFKEEINFEKLYLEQTNINPTQKH